MEQNELIHTATTMANRYTTLNNAAEAAKHALQNVRSELFEGILDQQEKNVLFEARAILEKISDRTHHSKAHRAIVKHLQTYQ